MKTIRRLLLLLIVLVLSFSASACAEFSSVTSDAVRSMLGLTFSVIDCDYDINGNSSGYVIRFSSEDYSLMYLMAQLFGNEDTDKLMNEAALSTAELCSELRRNIELLGVKNPNLTLILTDDTEKDYIFLIVCNGQVVYDILAD